MRKDRVPPIYETTGHFIDKQIFGGESHFATLHLKPESMDGVLDNTPGMHTYIMIAGKVVLLPGVLRSNN